MKFCEGRVEYFGKTGMSLLGYMEVWWGGGSRNESQSQIF